MNKKLIGILIICLFIETNFIPNINGTNNKNNFINCSNAESEKLTLNNDGLLKYLAGYKIQNETCKNICHLKEPTQKLPDNFDWRNYDGKDWTTPVKNQGNCGSCWLFAAVGALESVINIVEGDPDLDLDLSEQYVLSCLPAAGSCNGGDPYLVFECILDDGPYGNYVNGIIYEQCMPYQADDSISCSDKCTNWKKNLIPIFGCGESLNPEINEIKNKIYDGPIVSCVCMYTNIGDALSFDENGVYRPDDNSDFLGPHGIVVVGYQDTPDNPNYEGFWICKNSWGSDWGPWNNGFFGIAYNQLGFYMSNEVPIIWVEYVYNFSNFPPKQPTINGNTNIFDGKTYNYTILAIDPNGDNLYYKIDWDDDTFSDWIGPYTSGEEIIISHLWNYSYPYTFNVSVIAKDLNDLESNPSEPLNVNIKPRLTIEELGHGLGFFIHVKNNDLENDINDVDWNFKFNDFKILFSRQEKSGIVDIPAGEIVKINTNVFGFGRGKIIINLDNCRYSDTAYRILFGPFVLLNDINQN